MTRDQAIDIARRRALNSKDTHAYLPVTDDDAKAWMPHEWVIDAIQAASVPLGAEQVVAAIYAVGAEAARRGEMFPQTSDEQLEDRHAVARVAEMLRWYEKNTGCARLRGWPGA